MTKDQFNRFKQEVKPGDVLFISSDSIILKIIEAGQGLTDHTWTRQLGHAAFVDEDGNIQESSIAKDPKTGKQGSGIFIRPLDAWFDNKDNQKWLIIMRLTDITLEQIKVASNKGKYLKSKNLYYPVQELVGTMGTEIKYNFFGMMKFINPSYFEQKQKALLLKHNPLNTDKGMYCIAFANHCMETAGLRIIPDTIDESVCKVGDGVRNKLAYTLKFIVPQQYKDYVKAKNQDFNLNIDV